MSERIITNGNKPYEYNGHQINVLFVITKFPLNN